MQPEPLIISASLLRWLPTCERRVWLDAHSDAAQREALSPAVVERLHDGVEHEEAIHAVTAPRMQTLPARDWAEAVEQTQRAMDEGAKAIIGACLEVTLEVDGVPVVVRGKVDRLVRVHRLSTLMKQKRVYAPVEIKQYTELSGADLLQLDCYVWMLTQMQGIEPPTAEFWLGRDYEGYPQRRIEHEYDEERFLPVLKRAVQLVSRQAGEPAVFLAAHCRECGWHSACKAQAAVHYDVSLLNGLRSETHEHFRQASITSMQQVAAMSVDELRQFRGIGKITAPALQSQARAWVEQRPIWLDSVPDVCQRPMWFFDIETDPYTQKVWSIGWSDHERNLGLLIVTPHQRKTRLMTLPDGRTVQRVALVADTDAAWRYFAEAVSPNEQHVAHWTGFDAGVMRSSAPRDVIERLNSPARFAASHLQEVRPNPGGGYIAENQVGVSGLSL
ncbi:MAG: TM0106 family RecB-like putative nuclease [Anaerolineae bacterium]